MSIYNESEKWLRESIESILNQSFVNFEFIIINDNPDRELNNLLLNEYKSNDIRIIIIKNEINIGLTKSLNIALKLAKGKYIARMDADDISSLDRFSKQVNFLDSNKKYIACGSNYININKSGGKEKKIKLPETDAAIRSRIVLNNPIAHPTLMFRKDIISLNNLIYDESLKYSQDYKFIFDLSQLGKLYNHQELLLKYRINENQISKKYSKDQKYYGNRVRELIIINTLKKLNIDIKITREIYGDNSDSFLNELNLLKNKNHYVILNNIKLSLLIYSNNKFKLNHYLKLLFSGTIKFRRRLRIIKYLNNVC